MKNLFFLICGLLFCMNSMADGLYISLYPKGESATRDFRSLEIIPTATHDGNQVRVLSKHSVIGTTIWGILMSLYVVQELVKCIIRKDNTSLHITKICPF